MALSRQALIEELCSLSDEDLEKLFEKFSSTYAGFRLKMGIGGGAVLGASFGGPIGAVIGAVVGPIAGAIVGGNADDKNAAKVREAVVTKDKLKLPDGFCGWAEDQKKKGEWLKFDKED